MFSRPGAAGRGSTTVMSARRCTAEDYIQFLLATPKAYTATEAARVQPDRPDAPASRTHR